MAERAKAQQNPLEWICPYWRKVAVVGGEQGPTVIALCGRKDENEGPLPPLADFGPRRRRCPFGYSRITAFNNPVIIVVREGKEVRIHQTLESCGEDAIRLLNSNWTRMVRKYREGRL